jgi:hypothetical protein
VLLLTLSVVFVRCQGAERTMRTVLIVIDAPCFDLGLDVGSVCILHDRHTRV